MYGGGVMYGGGGGGGVPYSRYSRSSSNFDTGSVGSGTPRGGNQVRHVFTWRKHTRAHARTLTRVNGQMAHMHGWGGGGEPWVSPSRRGVPGPGPWSGPRWPPALCGLPVCVPSALCDPAMWTVCRESTRAVYVCLCFAPNHLLRAYGSAAASLASCSSGSLPSLPGLPPPHLTPPRPSAAAAASSPHHATIRTAAAHTYPAPPPAPAAAAATATAAAAAAAAALCQQAAPAPPPPPHPAPGTPGASPPPRPPPRPPPALPPPALAGVAAGLAPLPRAAPAAAQPAAVRLLRAAAVVHRTCRDRQRRRRRRGAGGSS